MKQEFSISENLIKEALERASSQEEIYGHNTGHFVLDTEKENTTIGVLGELVVQNWFNDLATRFGSTIRCELSNYGDAVDLNLVGAESTDKKGLHVKTGLWRNWPKPSSEFGIHADQGIETSGQPLILVSLLKSDKKWPKFSRIEGYLRSTELQSLPIIQKGDRFENTGVISRTTNIVTVFGQYKPITEIADFFFKA